MIDVAGAIFTDTAWNADTVRVVGNLSVEDGVTLSIAPGTRVEFQGYFALFVAGAIVAVGTPAERIVFTAAQPAHFTIDGSLAGCWNGIRFESTAATNASSRLAYCVLEYSKAVGVGGGQYPSGGGALSAVDFSKLTIENCIFRHNVAHYGGALFFYRNANPLVCGNLLVDNHALENAGALYCGYSHPLLINNTLARNRIHNSANPYIDSCGILNFLSKPLTVNNIIRENDPDVLYLPAQIWPDKTYYTRHNNIEGYAAVYNNMDLDPRWVNPDVGDFRLSAESPCIDAADNTRLPPDALDLDADGDTSEPLPLDVAGRPRTANDPTMPDIGAGSPPLADLGAFEYLLPGDCDADWSVGSSDVASWPVCQLGPAVLVEGGRRVHVIGRVERPMLADVLALLTAAADSTAGGPRNGREASAC